METLGRDISHIKITAAIAVVVLVGAGIWELSSAMRTKTVASAFVAVPAEQSGTQDSEIPSTLAQQSAEVDPVTEVSDNAIGQVVGAYVGLQQMGQFSTTTGAAVAGQIGAGLSAPVSYQAMSAAGVHTTSDTSYQAMLAYRSALQASLKPLLKNTQPEYEIFGMYVQTKDQTYLDQLHAAAVNYRAAASSTALVTTPADAVSVELGLVNSMNEFAATLDDLADHATDPIASTVLLENYNQAENDVLTAFQALVTYEQSKTN